MRSLSRGAADDGALAGGRYRRLVESAETYRKALVVRLIGEVGLRTAEVTRLRPDDVRSTGDRASGALLDARAESGERDRIAYVPDDLRRSLDRYVRGNGIDADERVIDVSPRRVQMLVAEVADRAADRTGDASLTDVTAGDLRAHFARTLLVEERVDPRVVLAVGGWESFESFDRFLGSIDESAVAAELADADARAGDAVPATASDDAAPPVTSTGATPPATSDGATPPTTSDGATPSAASGGVDRAPRETDSFHDEFVRALLADPDARALVRLDAEGYVREWRDGTSGEERRDLVDRHLSAFYPADEAGRAREHLDAASETGGRESEGWRVDADGERFWSRTVLTARRQRGEIRGYTLLVWDRTDRRRRAEALRERAGRLERRTDVGDRARAVDDAVLSASDRDDLEAGVCERLTEGDEYVGAWIATSDLTDEQPTPAAAAGIDRSGVDALVGRFDEASTVPPWTEAVRDGAVSVAELEDTLLAGDADGPTSAGGADEHANDGDEIRVGAVTAVPLAHRETTYGVLAVATDRGAPADWERSELSALGRRIGHALAAIQRRNLLLSDAAVELEFRCRDEGAFFVDASARLDCTFSLESIAPVSASSLLFHVTVAGADPGDVFDLAVEHRGVEEVRLVETHGDGALLEFVVGGDSPLLTLAAHGATITDAAFESGDGDLVAEVAQDADLRAVVDGLRTAFPDTELVGKREVERPVRTVREFREGVEDELTDRQEATLRAAYYAGYFDWPRGSTAEEVADSMDVSSPTLHNHLRKGQRALLDTFFEGSVGGE